MGVRTDTGALGKSPGFGDVTFLNDCKRFLIGQINIVKPKLIIELGQYVWAFLADLSPNLEGLNNINTFNELDNSNLNRIENVSFNGSRVL